MCTTGKNLMNLRKKKKLSRRALSEMSGVSAAYITAIEGDRRNPTLEVLHNLATALNVKVSDIVKDVNKDEIETFGSEIDKMCLEYGIDTSKLSREDFQLVLGQVLLIMKRLEKSK